MIHKMIHKMIGRRTMFSTLNERLWTKRFIHPTKRSVTKHQKLRTEFQRKMNSGMWRISWTKMDSSVNGKSRSSTLKASIVFWWSLRISSCASASSASGSKSEMASSRSMRMSVIFLYASRGCTGPTCPSVYWTQLRKKVSQSAVVGLRLPPMVLKGT
jgi:hypothetical protein